MEKNYSYEKYMKNSFSISQLEIGKKYYFVTKDKLIFLGKFYEKIKEIESECWHDGPTFIIKLKFEYDLLSDYDFHDDSNKGFVEEKLYLPLLHLV